MCRPSYSNMTPRKRDHRRRHGGHTSSRMPKQAPMVFHKCQWGIGREPWSQARPISPKMGLPNPHSVCAPWAYPPLLARSLLAPAVGKDNLSLPYFHTHPTGGREQSTITNTSALNRRRPSLIKFRGRLSSPKLGSSR